MTYLIWEACMLIMTMSATLLVMGFTAFLIKEFFFS